MGDRATFAEELRTCMDDHGYKLERLARESAVAKSTIHHWLSGSVTCPYGWENVLKVARALNLSRARTNRLLRSARLPTLERLAAGAQHAAQKELLAHWGK